MNASQGRSRSPVDPQTLEAVSNLRLKVRNVVQGLQGGVHPSLHLGASVEFAEHKKYSAGDDIRHIDWQVLARTDRFFVKQHQREVVLRCLMLLDCSASMGYGGSRARARKFEYAVELLAAMAHILVRQGDAAGLMTFGAKPLHFIPPERRPDHLSALMNRLATVRPERDNGTDFQAAIAHAADRAGSPAMVVVASDLWGAGRETEVALAQLAVRGHDVAVFHLLDPDEIDLPFDSPTIFRGLEGETEIEVDPSIIRHDYRNAMNAVRDRWRMVCGEAGIDLATVVTSEPASSVLADFITRRHGQGGRR